jgi:hypothetical protein
MLRPLLRVTAFPVVFGASIGVTGWGLQAGLSPVPLVFGVTTLVALGVTVLERVLPYEEAWSKSHGDGDRTHQRPWESTRPPPDAPIQRRLPPQQLVTPTRSTFQHRQRPQNSSCGSSWIEPSLPVALLASGVLLQVHRYGGPLADRGSDASTRSVAGGITTSPVYLPRDSW